MLAAYLEAILGEGVDIRSGGNEQALDIDTNVKRAMAGANLRARTGSVSGFTAARRTDRAPSVWPSSTARFQVSGAGGLHPRALSEPYMNLSIHTAPIIQAFATTSTSERRAPGPCAGCALPTLAQGFYVVVGSYTSSSPIA